MAVKPPNGGMGGIKGTIVLKSNQARAPVLGLNEFYFNTKRLRKVI